MRLLNMIIPNRLPANRMPILEIHDVSTKEGLHRATSHVLSVMLFPRDAKERRRFFAALAVRHLSMAED